jgi:ATP-dependent Clp protease ATP-binding subunit ClpA
VVQLFERFTDTARRVVVYAKEESLLLGHDHIGTEHILLGLLRDDTESGAQVLRDLDVDFEQLRHGILAVLRSRQQQRPAPGIFTSGGSSVESRLTAIEDRLERIERLLRDGSGRDSA